MTALPHKPLFSLSHTVVTGAQQGIGLAIAVALAQASASIVANYLAWRSTPPTANAPSSAWVAQVRAWVG